MQLTHGKPLARASLLPSHTNPAEKWIRESQDSERLQARDRIGVAEFPAGCLQGVFRKIKEGMISTGEESEHGSFLTRHLNDDWDSSGVGMGRGGWNLLGLWSTYSTNPNRWAHKMKLC